MNVALVVTSVFETDNVLPVLCPLVPQEVSIAPSLLYLVQVYVPVPVASTSTPA